MRGKRTKKRRLRRWTRARMDDRRSSFSLQAWLARLWAQGLPCPARVGCRPSSDGVQGWLLRCAVDAGWLICVASRSPSSARLGWMGGWWEKNAAPSKPEIDEAGRQGSRESTALFDSGMLSFINIKIPNLELKHALELCSLFANVSVLLSRVRGARDLVVPRYALRHIVDFPRRARPVPGRAGSAGFMTQGLLNFVGEDLSTKVYGNDITYHCHRCPWREFLAAFSMDFTPDCKEKDAGPPALSLGEAFSRLDRWAWPWIQA